MKPSPRQQQGRGKTLKPLCPLCNTYLHRQSVKLGPAGSQTWKPVSWICLGCGYMELDKERFKKVKGS